ncbi:MAG: guanylate kinase [Anaerolineaceae bacterium]|nr:guanylate kinase [Anaerolineaceae bacterium]
METQQGLTFNLYHPEPLLIVVSGLSGAGKDTIVKALEQSNVDFQFVVTATSRPPRKNEVHGKDYFFYSKEEFEQMIRDGKLIEYAIVYDQYKGVPQEQVDSALQSGKDVVMRLDYQGAEYIQTLYPEAILIFILPENEEEWCQRLLDRGEDSEEQLRIRLETAKKELEVAKKFDYVIINRRGALDEAIHQLTSIILAEHHRIHHRKIA